MIQAALLAAVLLGAGAAPGGPPSVEVLTGDLDFGPLSPDLGDRLAAPVQLKVVSPQSPWTLRVRASGALVDASGTHRLPLRRLRVGVHGASSRTAFEQSEVLLLAQQPPTGPEGRLIALDYSLAADWGDRATASGYSTQLQYLMEAAPTTGPFASPNPFSPDGDGLRDVTHVEGAEGLTATVADASGRTLRILAPAGGRLSWDGKDAAGLPLPEGAYTLLLSRAGAVTDRLGLQLERGAASGKAQVVGRVEDTAGRPLDGVQVELRRSSGVLHATARTGTDGAFAFQQVGAGDYFLRAFRSLYLTRDSPAFTVAEGAVHPQRLRLMHNHSLALGVRILKRVAGGGELVPVELVVRGVGTTDAEQVSLDVRLPAGLEWVPGSTSVDGQPQALQPPVLAVGTVRRGETRTVSLSLAVVKPGRHLVSFTATGTAAGEPFTAGPAHGSLQVMPGDFTGMGGLLGRTCYDLGADGFCQASDPAATGVTVVLEEGSHALSDHHGRYHLAPLRPGPHAVLAGRTTGVPELRGGSLPSLPREQTTTAWTFVPAGQYVRMDLPLPVPPGFVLPVEPRSVDPDEGAILYPVQDTPPPLLLPSSGPAADEGAIGEGGELIGLKGIPVAAAPRPTQEVPGPLESGPQPPRSALLGVADGQLTLGLGGDQPFGLAAAGQVALSLQHDFDRQRRLSLVIDTGRDSRQELLAQGSLRESYHSLGDEAVVNMSREDRAYVRLDLPGLAAQAGRLGVNLGTPELLYLQQAYLGAQLELGGPGASARVFGGHSVEAELEDVLPGEDSTGPYRLSQSPVVPGSERVEVETRAADGSPQERRQLRSGSDYLLDPEQGVVTLFVPLPAASVTGETYLLRVRYRVFTSAPVREGWLAGARVDLGRADRRASLIGLYRWAGGGPAAAAVVDTALSAGPLSLEAAAGLSTPETPSSLLDASAGRLRASVRVGEGLRLLAYGHLNGTEYWPTIRSDQRSANPRSPFGLLEINGLAISSFSTLNHLMDSEVRDPYLLPDAGGVAGIGSGVIGELGGVRALSLVTRQWRLDGAATPQDALEIAVRARTSSSFQAYAAHRSASVEGGLFDLQAAEHVRQTVVGTQATFRTVQAQLDYQHRLVGAGPSQQHLHEAQVKSQLTHFPAIRPGVLLGTAWSHGADGAGTRRTAAVGAELPSVAGVRAFAYGYLAQAEGALQASASAGAFGGLEWRNGPNRFVDLRLDHHQAAAQRRTHLQWNARVELLPALSVASDGRWRLGEAERLWRVVAAYRPEGPLHALARYVEEGQPAVAGSQLIRTVGADLGWTPSRGLRFDAKYLLKLEQQGATASSAQLGALSVLLPLPHRWDVRVGGRYLRDAAGGAPGVTAEVGYTLAGMLRLAGGVNAATAARVLEIDRQTPGVFLHLTGVYGGAFGGALEPPPRDPELPLERVVLPALARATPVTPASPEGSEGAVSQAPAAVATAVPPGTLRTVSGVVFRDLDGDAKLSEQDPVVDLLALRVGETDVSTNLQGEFSVENIPGDKPTVITVGPKADAPLGYRLAPTEIPPGAEAAQVELVLERVQPWDAKSDTLRLQLPDGLRSAVVLRRATFPLAAWIAGLPLSEQEQDSLQQMAEEVMAGRQFRLVLVSHAQTEGALKGNFKRARRGARQLGRYLKGAQMVPSSRILNTLVEPMDGVVDPMGKIEILLVRLDEPKS